MLVRARRAAVLALLLACGCKGPLPPRRADASRPPLTDARISRVVALAKELRPLHPDVAGYLDEPSVGIGIDEASRIYPAVEIIGADGVAALRARGEDPQAFVRDVFWMRMTFAAVRRGGTVHQKIQHVRKERSKVALLQPLLDTEARRIRPALDTVVAWHSRIGVAEEAAVRARAGDIGSVLFRRAPWAAPADDSLPAAP